MKTNRLALTLLLGAPAAGGVSAQAPAYPPLSEYLMVQAAESALARSAAPDAISSHASVKVLTRSGYQLVATGDNGFVCLVLRGWAAPSFTPVRLQQLMYDAKLRAPICYDQVASRTVVPLQELRARLAIEGRDPAAIGREVAAAYGRGDLPRMESVAFAYMLSAGQYLGPKAGAWRPHMMIYAPYYRNTMLGGNALGGPLPAVMDDEGTPFTTIVMPVDGNPAIQPGIAHHSD